MRLQSKYIENWSSRPHDWSFSLISGLCDSNCTLQCNYSQNWSSLPHEWSSLIRGPPSEDQCFMVGRYTHTVQSLYLPTTSGNALARSTNLSNHWRQFYYCTNVAATVTTIPTSRSKFILLTPKKKGSSLGGPRMREDRSWGSEDPLLPLNALYSVFTVERPTNEGEGPLVRAWGAFFM